MVSNLLCKIGIHNYIEVMDIVDKGHFKIEKCIKCGKKNMFQLLPYREQIKLIKINVPNRLKRDFASLGENK